MPLISVGHEPTLMTRTPEGFAFWMTIAGKLPVDAVWVWATAECLRELDPSKRNDADAALEVVNMYREVIENAASAKFDREGTNPADGLQEGRPILFVRSDDVP